MATMIPEKPRQFEEASQEGTMFAALEKLPDDYYVFHSFRITKVKDNVFHESETDFVIFHQNKGILCLEAKAGRVKYERGVWRYANGDPMRKDGPFNQAASNKWKLMHYIEESRMNGIIDHCKFLHAVWFPSVTEAHLRTMIMPPEGDKKLVLTKEALDDPQPFIDRIFDIDYPGQVQTKLSSNECQRLIQTVLCPQFDVFPAASFDADLKKMAFHRMLREQAGILNYLGEQRTAVINGAAGTGKTMIAVEKAQRHAAAGQRVLFLCYNARLKDHLSTCYPNENIDYYTIAGLACKLCNTSVPSYPKLKAVLEDMYLSDSFPYIHVVVDEGQDFGLDDIEEGKLLQMLRDIVNDCNDAKGTFYIFYDKLQLVQGRRIPEYIEDADCKLTLYKNCRNTENIAITSTSPLTDRKPLLMEGCVKGTPATMYFCTNDSITAKLDDVLESYKAKGLKNIVILTTKTEESSALKDVVKGGLYNERYQFTTCRKFKGLEADVIVLVDVDRADFTKENILLFYVGASRARISLDIISSMTNEDCSDVLTSYFDISDKIKRPQRELAGALHAVASK